MEKSLLLNPYIAGNPLKDKNAFYGREDILREVLQMLNHPDEKAIVLYGQRRIGKTSILLQIDQHLAAEKLFTPVYFDLQDRASSALSDVLYKLAQTISDRVKQPLPSFERFDDEGQYFIREFLPETIKFAAPEGIVLLFDEFDVMDSPQNNQAGQAFFPYLRSFISGLEHIKFVFVIGRRPEELSTETLSTFKGIRATRVSLLNRDATESVIRQSEKKKSLFWSNEAVDQVWKWTQGHSYFTQLLCSVIWERLQEKSSNYEAPTVLSSDVDAAIQEALKYGSHAFHWIWDGLPPAERVVMAAMAEAGENEISQEQIEEILNRSGVRLIVRELKIAPMTLIDWELLSPVDGHYRFAVPLLQRWVKSNRPLIRVKEELDRLDPLAESLFRSGQIFYSLGKKDDALQQLRQALNVNPNHLKSRLLLGRILLEGGNPDSVREAVRILDEAYKYDKVAVEADLIKTLLAYSDTKDTDDEKLDILDQILEMRPNQPVAKMRRSSIWSARGDDALQRGEYATASKAFDEAGDTKKIALVRETQRQQWHDEAESALKENNFNKALELFQLAEDETGAKHVTELMKQQWRDEAESALKENNLDKALELFHLAQDETRVQYVTELIEKKWMDEQLSKAAQAEKQDAWEQVVQIYHALIEKYPNHEGAPQLLKKAEEQLHLAQTYKQAIEFLRAKEPEKAQPLIAQIVGIQPDYKDAARYLYEIVDGRYSPVQQISRSQEFIQGLGRIAVIIIVWIASFFVMGFVTISIAIGISSSSSDASSIVLIVGGLISFILSTGAAIYLGIILFRKQTRDKNMRK